MENDIILQSLTESFEIIKDSWESKKETIINCIVETEQYDGGLAMDMWLYILNKEGEQVGEDGVKYVYFGFDNKMEECIGDVFKAFVYKYEEFDSSRLRCKVFFDHIVPHIIKNDKLLEILFEKSAKGYCTEISEGLYRRIYKDPYIPALIACIYLMDNPVVSHKITNYMINWDNSINWEENDELEQYVVSIGGLIRFSKEYIHTVYRNKEDYNKEYVISNRVKEALLSSIEKIEYAKNRAECTIEILSL